MTVSKRERLLDCASALFQQYGFRATGIDRILEASGCAKMTLYNHFRSKEELILACVRRTDEAWRNAVMKKIENSSKDPRERLLAVFDAVEEMIQDDRFCGCFFSGRQTNSVNPKIPSAPPQRRTSACSRITWRGSPKMRVPPSPRTSPKIS